MWLRLLPVGFLFPTRCRKFCPVILRALPHCSYPLLWYWRPTPSFVFSFLLCAGFPRNSRSRQNCGLPVVGPSPSAGGTGSRRLRLPQSSAVHGSSQTQVQIHLEILPNLFSFLTPHSASFGRLQGESSSLVCANSTKLRMHDVSPYPDPRTPRGAHAFGRHNKLQPPL